MTYKCLRKHTHTFTYTCSGLLAPQSCILVKVKSVRGGGAGAGRAVKMQTHGDERRERGTDLTRPADSRPGVVSLRLTGQNLWEMGKTELNATSGFKVTKHSTHENEVILAKGVLMQTILSAQLPQILQGKRGHGHVYVYKRRL